MTLISSFTLWVALCMMASTGVHGHTCNIKGDPHVQSFTEYIKSSHPFPCVYLAAHLRFATASGNVNVKVYTSSGLETFNGRYFVNYVKAVVDNGASGGYSVTYESDTDTVLGGAPGWTSTTTGTVPAEVSLTTEYDAIEEKAVLLVSKTGNAESNVKVSFFPRTTDHDNNRGLKIRLSTSTTSVLAFPNAICSTLSDTSGTSTISGSYTDPVKLMLASLEQAIHQDNAVCQDVINNVYANCGPDRRTAAAYCHSYLETHKAGCLQEPSQGGSVGDSLTAFRDCLEYMCGRDVVPDCDHCDKGPLCNSSACKSLQQLECVTHGNCLQGAKCVNGECRIEADFKETCLGCHRVCASDKTCDTSDHLCRIPSGYICTYAPAWCEAGTTCDCGINQCRILVDQPGCVDNDDLCVGSATCVDGFCKLPTVCAPGYEIEECKDFKRCVKYFNHYVTSQTASQNCRAVKGGRLFLAKDATELQCLRDYVKGKGATPDAVWLGADDMAVERTWLWADCTQLPTNSPLWAPGEPNDAGGEDCLSAYINSNSFNDLSCFSQTRPYVCEHEVLA